MTPYIGSTAQPPTTVSGTPPATSATVTGLTNGTSYTFTVAATNGVGTGPESAPSAAVTPAVPPAPTVPVVDVKVSVNATGATATTPSFSTAQPNETLLAFTTTDGPASSGSQTSTVSGAGLSWTLVGRANTRYGTSEVWSAAAATALSSVTVKATEGLTSFHQSLTVVAFKGSAGTGAVSAAGAASGAPIATLTTTRGSSLVYAAGNDWDGATARTPGTNQVLVNQWVDAGVGDTFWVQAFVGSAGPAGTAVIMNDTAPVNHQWNLVAVEVLSVTG